MSSVTTNSVQGDSYVWTTSPFLWDNITGIRTWASAYEVAISANVTEDTFSLSDYINNSPKKVSLENLVITDDLSFNVTQLIAEVLGISESYTDNINFIIKVLENILFAECLHKDVIVPYMGDESLGIIDLDKKGITQNSLEDFSISDLLANNSTKLSKEEFRIEGLTTGSALKFDGIDDYVTIPDSTLLRLTDFTIEMWASFDIYKDYGVMLQKGVGNSAILWNYGLLSSANNITFYIGDGVALQPIQFPVSSIPSKKWHHIVARADGTSLSLFIDKVKVTVPQTIIPNSACVDPILIGGNGAGRTIDGEVANTKIWNRALTDAEVELAFDGISPSGIVGEWKMNEGTGTTISDFSGNANHGNVVNALWSLSNVREFYKSFTKANDETLALIELIKNAVKSSNYEELNISDIDFKDVTSVSNETVAFVELLQKLSDINKFEGINITDIRPTFDMESVSSETLQFIEFYSDLISFHLAITEVVNFVECLHKDIIVPKMGIETLDIVERQFKDIDNVELETINFAEKDSKKVTSISTEGVNFEEIPQNHPTSMNLETFGIAEEVYKDYIRAVYVSLTVDEEYTDKVSFIRTYTETLDIIDEVAKDFGLNKLVALQIIESWLRHANATISDIAISNIEMTLENFGMALSPVGYTDFKNFQTGDYTYKDALIRIILEAGVTSDRPNIDKWEFNVDLPDVTDRGTTHLTLANQPLTVTFNRKFYTVPEVIITVKSASTTGAKVSIGTITSSGFTVELKDGATTIDGYISWSAVGY